MKKNKKIKKAKKTEKKKLPKTTILDILNEKDSSSKLLPSALASEIKPFTKRKRQNSQNTSRTISVNQTIITNNKSISTSNNITSIIPNSNEEYNKQIKSKIVIKDGKFSIEKKDIGLIYKQFNDEQNKNNFPLQMLDNNKKITSLSFKKLKHTQKWNDNDTKLFYKALEIFGLDFSFLEIVLKPRTRFEIKKKYLKEEKKNPQKIEKIVNSKKNVNKMYEILKIFKNVNDENNVNNNNNIFLLNNNNNNNNNNNKYEKILLEKNNSKNEEEMKKLIDDLGNFDDEEEFNEFDEEENKNNNFNDNNNLNLVPRRSIRLSNKNNINDKNNFFDEKDETISNYSNNNIK